MDLSRMIEDAQRLIISTYARPTFKNIEECVQQIFDANDGEYKVTDMRRIGARDFQLAILKQLDDSTLKNMEVAIHLPHCQFNDSIFQYIRDKKNNRIGVMVAIEEGDNIHLGFSMCHKNDIFNAERGIAIALGRAKTHRNPGDDTDILTGFKRISQNDIERFMHRAHKYFQ